MRRPHRGAGFTLLEVLLALALSVILLVALNTALDLYRKFSTAGRADIEQAQLARAIMQKIETDVRCAVSPPKSSESKSPSTSTGSSSSSSGSSSSGSSSSSATGGDESAAIQIVDPSAAYTKNVVGVLGDSQTLVLTICRPTRPLSAAAALADSTPRSDMKSVSYFLVEEGADGLRGQVASQWAATGAIASTSSNGGNGVHGLARLEGDRLAISKADETTDIEALAQHTKFLAAEVNFLQFRYSDGLEWYDTWDGTVTGLPRAVEITVGFPPEGTAPAQRGTVGETAVSSELYRLVVAIPSTSPLTTTEGL